MTTTATRLRRFPAATLFCLLASREEGTGHHSRWTASTRGKLLRGWLFSGIQRGQRQSELPFCSPPTHFRYIPGTRQEAIANGLPAAVSSSSTAWAATLTRLGHVLGERRSPSAFHVTRTSPRLMPGPSPPTDEDFSPAYLLGSDVVMGIGMGMGPSLSTASRLGALHPTTACPTELAGRKTYTGHATFWRAKTTVATCEFSHTAMIPRLRKGSAAPTRTISSRTPRTCSTRCSGKSLRGGR